ncbi:MAG TPA: molybdopterin-dependent oxidoreductase, partial [Thermoanaerobaculia bacterium]|nr:molybdopterin-dependent oxidoreductase [Thermoanaerobaculia bacterium]
MAPIATHPRLRVRQEDPLNAEPAPGALIESFRTPNELFFIRGHGNIPEVDAGAFRLTVDGLVESPLSLSLADLRRLPRTTAGATLQCAGNRRRELIEVSPIPNELPWDSEAVSNAEWSGVPLREALAAAGPKSGALHVAFLGLDETERHGHRFQFGGSIPLEKAMRPEVLLADTMNGEPLPPAHGAPLRVVVPGYIGARSVKWISRITLQESPSDNYFQAKAYRLFPASVGPDTVDWDTGW